MESVRPSFVSLIWLVYRDAGRALWTLRHLAWTACLIGIAHSLARLILYSPGFAATIGATARDLIALMFAAGVGWRELSSIVPEKDALEAVRMLWDLGGFDINAATGTSGQTALHGAASRGAPSIIQFLVDHGASLAVKDRNGRTPLDEAGAVEDGPGGGSNTHQVRPEAQALLRRLMDAAGAARANQ